jgi:hypothetical protein
LTKGCNEVHVPIQVVNGATLMCTMGMAPSSLVVLPLPLVFSSNQPAATIMDNVPMLNILPFGMCMSVANPMVASATAAALGVLTPMPCIPATVAPWTPGQPLILIGNKPALDNTCTLMCMWAGVISVVVPGQFTHFIGCVATGLGADVDSLAAMSPSLQQDLETLQKDGWKIEYGPAGGGSYADRDSVPPRIVIDSNVTGNPTAAVQTLAHEVGHATYGVKPDLSSKAAYVNGALADEGAATLNNIAVQREISANGGPDIGIAGNPANHAAYNQAYDGYLADGDAPKARAAIGAQFGSGETTSTTGQTYSDYYGGWYDTNHPP